MTGPEHYREAERLREHAREMIDKTESAAYFNAAAQVHATLALAAATFAAGTLAAGENVSSQWVEALS
jgi:hypothetical protein